MMMIVFARTMIMIVALMMICRLDGAINDEKRNDAFQLW